MHGVARIALPAGLLLAVAVASLVVIGRAATLVPSELSNAAAAAFYRKPLVEPVQQMVRVPRDGVTQVILLVQAEGAAGRSASLVVRLVDPATRRVVAEAARELVVGGAGVRLVFELPPAARELGAVADLVVAPIVDADVYLGLGMSLNDAYPFSRPRVTSAYLPSEHDVVFGLATRYVGRRLLGQVLQDPWTRVVVAVASLGPALLILGLGDRRLRRHRWLAPRWRLRALWTLFAAGTWGLSVFASTALRAATMHPATPGEPWSASLSVGVLALPGIAAFALIATAHGARGKREDAVPAFWWVGRAQDDVAAAVWAPLGIAANRVREIIRRRLPLRPPRRIGRAVRALGTVVRRLVPGMWSAVQALGTVVRPLVAGMWSAVRALGTVVRTLVAGMWSAVQALGTVVRTLVAGMWSAVQALGTVVRPLVADMWHAVRLGVRDERAWLVALTLAGLAFRLFYLREGMRLGALPYGPDAPAYVGEARVVLGMGTDRVVSSYVPPLGWMFLVPFFAATAYPYMQLGIVQAVLGSALIPLTYVIARRVTRSRMSGLVTAAMVVAWPPLVYWSLTVGAEFLQIVLVPAFLVVALAALRAQDGVAAAVWAPLGIAANRVREIIRRRLPLRPPRRIGRAVRALGTVVRRLVPGITRRPVLAAAAGLVGGLLLLAKPVYAPTLLLFVAMLVLPRPSRRRLATAALALGAAVLVIAPWSLFTLLNGSFVIISSNGESTMWLGMHPFSTGTGTYPTAGETEVMRELGLLEPSPPLPLRLAGFYLEHPYEFLVKTVQKSVLWFRFETFNHWWTLLAGEVNDLGWRLANVLVFALGLLRIAWGIARRADRSRAEFLLIAALLLQMMAVPLLISIETRYFVPILPLFLMLAVDLILRLAKRARRLPVRARLPLAAAVPIAIVVAFAGFAKFDTWAERVYFYEFTRDRPDWLDVTERVEQGVLDVTHPHPYPVLLNRPLRESGASVRVGADASQPDVLTFVMRFDYEYPIRSLRVIDRVRIDEAGAAIEVDMSTDGRQWKTIYRRDSPQPTAIENDWLWYAADEPGSPTRTQQVLFRYRLTRQSGSNVQPALTVFMMQLNLEPLIPSAFFHDNLSSFHAAEPERF